MAERQVFDPFAYNALLATGEKLQALRGQLDFYDLQRLDHATVQLEEGPHDTILARAALEPSTLGGFAALLGLKEEFETLFPNGARMILTARQDGSRTSTILMGDSVHEAAMLTLAETSDPHYLTIAPTSDHAHGTLDRFIPQIAQPHVVGSIGDCVLGLVQRAAQQLNQP